MIWELALGVFLALLVAVALTVLIDDVLRGRRLQREHEEHMQRVADLDAERWEAMTHCILSIGDVFPEREEAPVLAGDEE